MQHINTSVFIAEEFGPYLVEFDAATGKVNKADNMARVAGGAAGDMGGGGVGRGGGTHCCRVGSERLELATLAAANLAAHLPPAGGWAGAQRLGQ